MRSLLIEEFQSKIYEYYDRNGRHDLPWRISEVDGSFDPYKILISELMLQQTQVSRVIPKYQAFVEHFPTSASLASSTITDVLRLWSGLGYNRRAQYLYRAIKQVGETYGGVFPNSQLELTKLPGVGTNTAGAILAYAFNQPAIFVETNIRTVYIHYYFHDSGLVSDKEINLLVEETLDRANPRIWYWALMDYGSYLKHSVGNLSRQSKSYTKQSKFEGSQRQIRGLVVRLLLSGPQRLENLAEQISDDRLISVLEQLVSEGLIQQNGDDLSL